MEDHGPAARCISFGPFEFDARSGLLRNGVSEQYLADQPLSLLTALVERPGELVTREELRQRLWPDGTFVGFDHGLNSAINRLREALNDSADTPRLIETIPRRGYRLLVPIVVARPTIPAAMADAHVDSTLDDRACTAINLDQPAEAYQATPHETSGTTKRTRRLLWWMAVTAIGVLSLGGLLWPRRGAQPAPLLANVALDVPADWRNFKNHSPAISPDSQYLAISAFHRSGRSAIWLRPLGGTTWHMLSHTENGTGPFWSPDGRSIGFFAEDKLKVLRLAEGSVRVVCDAPPGSGTFDLLERRAHRARTGRRRDRGQRRDRRIPGCQLARSRDGRRHSRPPDVAAPTGATLPM